MDRLLVTTSVDDDTYWSSLATFVRSERRLVHHMLYPHCDGRFAGVRIDPQLERFVRRMELCVRRGDQVRRAADGSNAIGFVDLAFDDGKE